MRTVNLLLASDLHLDVANYDLRGRIISLRRQGHRIDGVLLAGDIVEVAGGSPIAYAVAQVPTDIPTFFVPGNHEFYGGLYGNLLNLWRAQAKGSHVRMLIEESCVVSEPGGGQVVLLGTPLWSNLGSLGPLVEADLCRTIVRQISDFSSIRASDGSRWTVAQMLALFEKSLLFLERELSPVALEDGRRRVVMTHFGPHRESIAPRWRHDAISAYFCNHLPELVERADLWVHGHTHDRFEYQVGDDPARGLVVCHPRGYAGGQERAQALAYEPRLLEVPVERVAWSGFEASP